MDSHQSERATRRNPPRPLDLSTRNDNSVLFRWAQWPRIGLLLLLAPGCASSPIDPDRLSSRVDRAVEEISSPVSPVPPIPAPPIAPEKAEAKEKRAGSGELALDEVLQSVGNHFPLLLAIEQERAIASSNKLAAEGGFDLALRSRGVNQEGSFENGRLDLYAEQPLTTGGVNVFGGYRLGLGDYPVYYGDRKTAESGEFRAGVQLPLLNGSAIDRRRVAVIQASITERLAEPAIQRARLDYERAAARAYWNWVAAGNQCLIAAELLKLAEERQAAFEEQFAKGALQKMTVEDGRRIVLERKGSVLAAERRLQQTAGDLSLYHRDSQGEPLLPTAKQLPVPSWKVAPPAPDPGELTTLVQGAISRRPEPQRIRLLKERAGVDAALAQNQMLPSANLGLAVAQDVGPSKKSSPSTGIFSSDRTNWETSLQVDLPLQRRESRGRYLAARATTYQILAQEKYLHDQITNEVRDAQANLTNAHARLLRAIEEADVAAKVADMERERFRLGASDLMGVNFRELFAASARGKVVESYAEYGRVQAELTAALASRP